MYKRIPRIAAAALFIVGFLFLTRAGRAQGPAILINEVLVGNSSTNIDPDYTNYSGWIELRNTTGSAINLKGYKVSFLADGATTAMVHTLPKGVTLPANGRLLIWADEEKKGTHTLIDLDMDGGVLSILAANNNVIDTITLGEQEPDVSIGRSPDGSGTWAYFDQPTPGAANTTPAFAAYDFTATPTFSVQGGLYSGPQSVALSSATVGATIRYTTDGSEPTGSSTLYSGPIAVNSTRMLRARAWAAGKMVSPTATQTYLINIPVNLPIISITTAPANLWDNQIGIYTKGSNGISNCNVIANWHQKWQRPANIEFYEMDGTRRLNQEVGLEIFGNCTRNYDRKSLEIKAQKIYGDNDMDYAFFPDDKPMTSYKRLILRNAGQDNGNALLRDAMIQSLVGGHMDLDWMPWRPAVVYLNGEYWGLYDMREKMDEDYVENNYGLDETEFDVLEQNHFLVSGTKDRWLNFYTYVTKNNPATPAVYANIKARMDVSEFMNYLVPHMFAGATSWPKRNSRFWDDHGTEFGWRWLVRDLDSGFESNGIQQDMVNHTSNLGGPTSTIFKNLLRSNEFKNEFSQRFAAYLNTIFLPSNVIGVINSMADDIRPEMPAHIARWGKPASMAEWESNVQFLRGFANQRPPIMRDDLRSLVGNAPDSTLTINVTGAAGRVLVAGAEVPAGYSGPHFRGVPITLTALPGPGTQFVRWQETGETNPVITIPFNGDTTRTAVYESAPVAPIVINELHHTPGPALDDNTYEFLELYNAGGTVVNLSGYTFPDAVTFTFPAGATIAAGGYVVVADTPATYAAAGCPVYDFSGGLSATGEAVTLNNNFGFTVDAVTYGSVTPWPSTPNGTGPSLSLNNPSLDNTSPANWAASTAHGGTPCAANFP